MATVQFAFMNVASLRLLSGPDNHKYLTKRASEAHHLP